MPHIKVSGISKEALCESVHDLKTIVIENSNAPLQAVRIFHVPMERVDAQGTLAIDICWIVRTQEMRDAVASKMTAYFQAKGYADVQVTFVELPANFFYENGTHL